MKTYFKILSVIVVLGLLSCEKNDPLADQGSLTGQEAPFNLLAQMADAKVGDTLRLRTVAWAANDDLETIAFFHKGFSVEDYSIKIRIELTAGPADLAVTFKTDSIKTERTLIKSYPESGSSLNEFYQTIESAYVIESPFIVPENYQPLKAEGGQLIDDLPAETYSLIAHKFAEKMNRAMMLKLFPSAPFSSFVIDEAGFFTGELTPAGIQYIVDNLSRDMFKSLLVEAKVDDNTRVTIESEARLKANKGHRVSARGFKVLP